MSSSLNFSGWIITLIVTAAFLGCSAQEQLEPKTTTTPPSQPAAAETAESSEDDAKIEAALATLSPEDRALAEKQQTCPVTDELLGSMGTPIKVTVEGREVFLCCQGCEDEIKSNFAKYEAKLPDA
ncbi:hypothetical protein [Aeoliella sp. SH292]|uniref:hypothetical protein n=1 Tax=Aeoliella sp. SH292 TaxID=3454464 RepID=UPI003F9BDB3C